MRPEQVLECAAAAHQNPANIGDPNDRWSIYEVDGPGDRTHRR